jgi:alkaline phosphatase
MPKKFRTRKRLRSCKILPSLFICMLCFFKGYAQAENHRSEVRNVILLIGDGMGTAQIYAGLTANKDTLNIERCPIVGFQKNQSANDYITDSGAGATAFSIGYKTNNLAIGVDATGVRRETILEKAANKGLSTGLVVSCSITHATPAAFYAHQPNRSMVEDIAMDLFHSKLTAFVGGGKDHFDHRKDGRNLIDSLRRIGYQVVDGLDAIKTVHQGRLAGFISAQEPPKVSEGRGGQLKSSLKTVLPILSRNKKGFFLMLEGSQIDWGGHQNDAGYMVNEMVDFDNAIGEALDFARKDGHTLVVITADHETGGAAITKGDMSTGMVEVKYVTNDHTGVMVPVFAYGPGSSIFSGIYRNTDIHDKILKVWNLK